MKIKEAFSRLGFTLSKQNKPNQTDVDAFNKIIDVFKSTEEKTVTDNLLFAKLYAHVLQKLTEQYNDADFANKQLNKLLSEPMSFREEMLLRQLKFTELHKCFSDPILKDKNEEELRETFRTHKKFEKEFITCWEWWDINNVRSNLKTQINLSLQNFKNYV